MNRQPRIGFLGIGLMGLPLCRRLLAAGFELTVYNRTPEKCLPLHALGAKSAHTPAEVVCESDVIMLCLADTAAVYGVATAPETGLFTAPFQHKIFVDLSSIDAHTTRELAEKCQNNQSFWIDAPVSGGVGGAENGTLIVMAGGERTACEATLEPIFAAFAQRVTWLGGAGCGQIAKLCNQLIVAANAVLIAEAVALAESAGVDATQLAPALAGGFADSRPFQILSPRMSQREFEPVQWKIDTLLKDLNNATAAARDFNLHVPVACLARDQLRIMSQTGHGHHDLSRMIHLYRNN